MYNSLTFLQAVVLKLPHSFLTGHGDNADISDMTDIQAMLLAENMSVFGNDYQVYDSMNITDMTADTSLTVAECQVRVYPEAK